MTRIPAHRRRRDPLDRQVLGVDRRPRCEHDRPGIGECCPCCGAPWSGIEVERKREREGDGRCGAQTVRPSRMRPPADICALPAGHDGWHRSDEGAEWSRREGDGGGA